MDDRRTKSSASVESGGARIVLDEGASSYRQRVEESVARDVDVALTTVSDQLGSGNNGLYLRLHARASARNDYSYEILIRSDGRLTQSIRRTIDGDAGGPALVQLTTGTTAFEVLQAYRVRFQVSGDRPARLRAKIWKRGEPEPERWTLEATDDAPELSRQA